MSVRDKDNVICHSHHNTSLQPVLKVLQLGVYVTLCFGHTSRTRLDTTLDRFYARGLIITAFGSTQVHVHLKGGMRLKIVYLVLLAYAIVANQLSRIKVYLHLSQKGLVDIVYELRHLLLDPLLLLFNHDLN